MKEIPVILLIAFTIGSIISLWVWHCIEKTVDEGDKDSFEYFEDDDTEDYDIDMENDDDTEFIKYWYS